MGINENKTIKKILVTGGAGYIGSHFLHFLLLKGIPAGEIIVFDNLERGFRENIPAGIKLIVGDLKKSEEIDSVFINNKIDCVVHFAAYAYVGESMNDPGKYFKNNVGGGLNLLEAMQKNNCKNIIFSSSCATYGIPERVPITEETAQQPINPYGETKLIFEKLLHWYSQIHSITFVALRYFNAAGADFGIGEMHNPETHLIPLALKSILEEKHVNVFGNDYNTNDGTCIRDYIHVTDLANAHFLAMKYLQTHSLSQKLNLGTGTGTSVKEIIEISEKISGRKAKINFCKKREGDPAVLVADPLKAKKILDWKPQKTIQNILEDAFHWEEKCFAKNP